MYKRYSRRTPEVKVIEWDGKDFTIDTINKLLCAKVKGFSVSRSKLDEETLEIIFESIIGAYKSFIGIGDVVIYEEAQEFPYKKIQGIKREELDKQFVLDPEYNLPREMSREDLFKLSDFLTVGKFKKFIDKFNVPDSAPVVIERIYDKYYTTHGWSALLKDSEHTLFFRDRNREIESGEDKDTHFYMSEQSLKLTQHQYHPAFCCVHYKDDSDILFIDLHY